MRCCSACIYYWNPYSNQQTWKSMDFLRFFEEISSQTSLETFSVTMECCLGHFWWKIFSSIFQLIFWIMVFARFRWKFHAFCSKLDGYVRLQQTKLMKTIGFFDEIMQKIWFKIGVGKSTKIFFIRNVPNNIPWSLKVFPVMPVTIFPRKTAKNQCFYCRDSNSKCVHYGIALQKRVCFMREGSRK